MRFFVVLASLLLLPLSGWAIEFKPHVNPQITEGQWTAYYEQVKAAHGATMEEYRGEHLVVFNDAVARTSYAFTQAGHAAHPAWIARKVVQEGNDIFVQQVGYFAGSEAPFAALFQQYQTLNQRMVDDLKRRRSN
jgi:hypothetical protein